MNVSSLSFSISLSFHLPLSCDSFSAEKQGKNRLNSFSALSTLFLFYPFLAVSPGFWGLFIILICCFFARIKRNFDIKSLLQVQPLFWKAWQSSSSFFIHFPFIFIINNSPTPYTFSLCVCIFWNFFRGWLFIFVCGYRCFTLFLFHHVLFFTFHDYMQKVWWLTNYLIHLGGESHTTCRTLHFWNFFLTLSSPRNKLVNGDSWLGTLPSFVWCMLFYFEMRCDFIHFVSRDDDNW
jgi:hypothetical protein